MPKSVHLHDETVKSGGPVGFVNLDKFYAHQRFLQEKMGQANGPASKLSALQNMPGMSPEVAEIQENTNHLPKYMVQMYEINRVVYCRYGRDYIP